MTDCPTPEKSRFHSRKEAKLWARRGGSYRRGLPDRAQNLRQYLCVCGFFHNGHLPPAVAEGRISRSDFQTRKWGSAGQ